MAKRKPVPIHDVDIFDRILGDLETVSQSSRDSLPLELIMPRKQQPRRFFDMERIEALASSIQEVGLLEPLVVRPVGDRYEIIAGERRYHALKLLGAERVDVVIRNLDDRAAFLASAIENLNREDLHPFEETDAIVTVLEAALEADRKAVLQLITKARTYRRSSSRAAGNSAVTEDLPKDVKRLLELLTTLGVSNVASFYTHRLPLLNYPEDLIAAMREGALDFTKAKQLARIADNDERERLLERICKEGITLRDLEREVARLLEQEKRPQPRLFEDFRQLKQVVTPKRIQNLEAEKQKKLKILIGEINALFS